jgi:hypothetical protein
MALAEAQTVFERDAASQAGMFKFKRQESP